MTDTAQVAKAPAAEPSVDAAPAAAALDNPQTQFNHGIALQSAGRHAEALDPLKAAQNLMPNAPAPFLHAAVSLLALGRPNEALHAASDACHRAPKSAQANYVYGQAWLALNAPARAERAFADAINHAPAWADAWVNYGIARYRQGAIEDAKTAMREALARQPDHAAATANLGAFMRLSGQPLEAETLLCDTVQRQPANAGARLNLVADLLQSERAAEALALLDEAAPPADNARAARHWHLQRSLALLQLRRPAEARAALDAFAALGPCPPEFAVLWQWRLVLLARAENDTARAEIEAERMEAVLAEFGALATPEHRVMAHFDLAKFWSGSNDPRRAMRHWTEGHALLKPSQPFSRDVHAAFVDANIELFNRARFETGARASNDDPAPVFIIGMPRSGTTLCEQILAAHRDVHGGGERVTLPQAFAALGGRSHSADQVRRIAKLDSATLDDAAATYLAELHALAPDKARIVDKMPGNYLYLGLIALMLPGAKFIYCARDPRDIGLSVFTFRFHGYHPYSHDLADLGWTIGQHGKLMDHWRAVLSDRIVTVNLSDWVEDFDGTLARVLGHIGLPPDPACVRFYESDSRVRTVSFAQVRQPVNARGLGRWKAYAAELAPLIGELQKAGVIAADEPGVLTNPSPQQEATSGSALTVWTPTDPAVALGLAVEFLMKRPVFAKLPFGDWTQVLLGQINRGHFFFAVDALRRVHGMLGWALTDEALAEAWVEGRAELRDEDCRNGDCVIINVLAGDSADANRAVADAGRRVLAGKRLFYAKRYYANGRTRPLRLPGDDLGRYFAAITALAKDARRSS